MLIDLVAESLNYTCHEVDVGFKNITAGMKKYDALLGGESSGGLTMRGYIFGKDATFAASLFMEMVIKLNKPVSQIIKEIKDRVHYNFHFYEDFINLTVDSKKVLEYMVNNIPKLSIKFDEVNVFGRNIKFQFPNRQWLLLRLSGTEPAFRVFAEFEDIGTSKILIKELKDYIEKVQLIIAKN
mgnify:CR=1 FL=1